MVKIFVDKNGGVDFEAPIYMSDRQKRLFIAFMKKLVPNIGVKYDVPEKEKNMGDRETAPRDWTKSDYTALINGFLDGKSERELSSELRRSEMSLWMKAGEIVPAYLAWDKEYGHDIKKRAERVRKFVADQLEGER